MLEKTLTIQNKLGMHARPAALLVEIASQFEAEIFISKDGLEINGKSIMGVLMLAATQGSQLDIRVDGNDEEDLFNEIKKLFNNKFNEE